MEWTGQHEFIEKAHIFLLYVYLRNVLISCLLLSLHSHQKAQWSPFSHRKWNDTPRKPLTNPLPGSERDKLPPCWQILLKPSLAIKGPYVFNQATPERCWNWSDFEIRVEKVAVAKLLIIPVSCTWWDVIIQKSEPECREGGQSLCCPQRDARVLLSEFTTLSSPAQTTL